MLKKYTDLILDILKAAMLYPYYSSGHSLHKLHPGIILKRYWKSSYTGFVSYFSFTIGWLFGLILKAENKKPMPLFIQK